MADYKEVLEKIRKNPRKLHKSYLKSHDLLAVIEGLVPGENYKIREKIDIILQGTYDRCSCGKLAKARSQWCSLTCRNKDPEIRASIGVKNSQNKITRAESLKETLRKKYGVSAVQSIPGVAHKTKMKKLEYYDQHNQNTFETYGLDRNLLSDSDHLSLICVNSSYPELSAKHFNDMPITTIMRHFVRIGFDPNFPKSSSSGERQIADYVESLGFECIRNDRSVIKPKELDIYIPSKNLAIEYHGLYWHSDNKFGHKEKRELCMKSGVTLLQFYEDEWLEKPKIVESIIATKLGISKKIHARRCMIQEVPRKTALEFLEDNHIQGSVFGKHYGLYNENVLVCLVTIGKSRFQKDAIELLRFCSLINHTVVGGFSKLLAHVKKVYKDPIYTYADLRYSNGSTYEKFGRFSHTTNPGYFWSRSSQRINRMRTQKHKLHKLLKSFDPTLSEKENMENNNYFRVWDCGNNCYVL